MTMSKLSAIRKQIAALEAQAERISKAEMSGAIAKVKSLMSEFGLTIEHLTQAVVGKRAAKKSKSAKTTKTKATSVAKYADPKSGKTWSGFGRAPAWIADAKNRDAFLVTAAATPAKTVPVKKAATTKVAAPAPKRAKTKAAAAAKPAGKKTTTAKKSVAPPTTVKKVATKKSVKAKAKALAKKAAPRKAAASAAAPAPETAG